VVVDPVALALISPPLAICTKMEKLVALKNLIALPKIANEEKEGNKHQGLTAT
jgi:hypothetical protein